MQAVGVDTHPENSTGTNSSAATGTGTGVTKAVENSPGTLTYNQLPQTGRIHPHQDGSVDVGSGEARSLAARNADGTNTATQKPPMLFEDDGDVATASDLNKSGTGVSHKDGTSDVKSAPTPGLFAAAVGRLPV